MIGGGQKEMSEQQKELRERAIQAIRQHNNYRGKPPGELPRWLDVLVKQDQFQQHAKDLKNDNALATYAVEQVKFISAKGGQPWGFRCLLYTSPSPRDKRQSRMPSSA